MRMKKLKRGKGPSTAGANRFARSIKSKTNAYARKAGTVKIGR